MLDAYALKALIFISVSSRRSFDMCLILSIASLANLFLRLISSDVSRRVPRYLHFFPFSVAILCDVILFSFVRVDE